MKLPLLCLGIVSILFSGCVGNAHLKPDRWVTVLDSNTGQPVAGVPLTYRVIRKPYFINLAKLEPSDPYVSGADGRAFVPNDKIMGLPYGTGWEIDLRKTYGTADDPHWPRIVDIYYVHPGQVPPSAK